MGRTDALRASIILLLGFLVGSARAQTSPALDSVPKVYLVTVEPGDAAWERFGHDMLVIGEPMNVAVNYGVFDFDAPNFIGNFVRGKMTYWMEGDDWPRTKEMYSNANRSMWMQELNLSPQQRLKLIAALRQNALPENKYYRYDYYKNNCTTKVRDAIDKAVDGEVYRQLKDIRTDQTYRDHTRIGMASYFWLYTGLELAMGPPCDVKLSAWQECFLPAKLMDDLKRVTIDDGSGNRVPLLEPTVELYKSTRAPLPNRPPIWWPGFLLVGVVIGGVMMLCGRRRYRKTFITIAIIWSLIAGLASVFMLCLWMFTDHEAGYRNLNLLQFSPFSLVVVVAALWGFRWKSARHIVIIPLALSVAGILVKVLPGFREWNWEMISFALPAHLGLAATAMQFIKTPMEKTQPDAVTRARNVNVT